MKHKHKQTILETKGSGKWPCATAWHVTSYACNGFYNNNTAQANSQGTPTF